MRITIRITTLIALLVACSSSETETTTNETTTGGEEDLSPPMILRTTTPVPVPSPEIAREEMSDPMQRLWTGVEEVVAIRPPEPPEQGTTDALNEWARGPFREWVSNRTEASRSVESIAEEVRANGVPFEDIVGGALFGYMYEDMAAGARGAPVPNEISGDPELLQIYTDALTQSIQPIASRSFAAYLHCATTFARMNGDAEGEAEADGEGEAEAEAEGEAEDGEAEGEAEAVPRPWAAWGAYCYERAREVDQVYELHPATEGGEPTGPTEPTQPTQPTEPQGEPQT